MQPSVKKGENLHFFNFSEVGINGGKHRLNPDSEVGARFFAEFTLNAVKGLNDNYLLVILNGASLREESQTKIKESAYKERSTSEFGLN
jgi:hypothetical protein